MSPGLFIAAFSLPSKLVGRSFALIELVRSGADFILAPILLRTARVMSHGAPLDAGPQSAPLPVGNRRDDARRARIPTVPAALRHE